MSWFSFASLILMPLRKAFVLSPFGPVSEPKDTRVTYVPLAVLPPIAVGQQGRATIPAIIQPTEPLWFSSKVYHL